MKAFYQPLMMIALGVIVAFLLLGPDKKTTEHLDHDKEKSPKDLIPSCQKRRLNWSC